MAFRGPFRQYQSDIDRQYILPALSDSDWFGAGQGATGLAAAAGGDVSSGGAQNDASGGGSWFWWLLLPGGILVAFRSGVPHLIPRGVSA